MKLSPQRLVKWRRGERAKVGGAALAEMGIALGLISVVAIGAVSSLGNETEDTFCEAAGSLDKAKGGDGYCLDEPTAASNVPPTVAPGYENGDFVSAIWPKGSAGAREILLPFIHGTPQAFDMVVQPATGDAEACYAMQLDGAVQCTEASPLARIAVPAGARRVGYTFDLPTDTGAQIDRDFALSFEAGGNKIDSWSINHYREPEGPPFDTSMAFKNVEFPMGTSGRQWVMVEKAGTFAEPMNFSVTPFGTLNFGACDQATNADDPTCQTLANDATSVPVATNDYALGYAVDLPADTRVDVVEGLKIDLTTPGYPMNSKSWTIAVTRPGNPTAVGLGLAFDDVLMSAGDPDKITLTPTQGVPDGPYTITATTASGADVSACYKERNLSTVFCGAARSVDPRNDIESVGFKIDLSPIATEWDAFDGEITLTASMDADPSVTESWTIHVSRPTKEVVFDPQMTLADITTAAGQATKQYEQTIGGEWNTPMTIEATTTDALTVATCVHESGVTAAYCWPSTKTVKVGSGLPYGYKIDFAHDYSEFEQVEGDVTVTISSVDFPELTRSWTFHVTRPAKTASVDITADLVDMEIDPSRTTDSIFQVKDIAANNSVGGWTISTDGNGLMEARPCVTRRGLGGYSCSTEVTTGRTEEYSWDSTSGIGFGIYLDSLGDNSQEFNGTVDVILTSKEDPNVSQTYSVNVHRGVYVPPPVFTPDAAFTNLNYAWDWDGEQDILYDLQGSFNMPAEIAIIENTPAPGTAPILASACLGTDCGSQSPKGPFSQGDVSQIGIHTDIRDTQVTPAGAAVDTTLVVEMRSVDDPSNYSKRWSVRVTRPALSESGVPNFPPLPSGYNAELSHEFVAGSTGWQTHMAPISIYGYTGGPPQVYTSGKNSPAVLRPCYQITAQDPVVCGAESANVTYIRPPVVPEFVGYQVILPDDTSQRIEYPARASLGGNTIFDLLIRRKEQ